MQGADSHVSVYIGNHPDAKHVNGENQPFHVVEIDIFEGGGDHHTADNLFDIVVPHQKIHGIGQKAQYKGGGRGWAVQANRDIDNEEKRDHDSGQEHSPVSGDIFPVVDIEELV